MRSAEDFDRLYETVDPWGVAAARFRDRTLRLAVSKFVTGRRVLELGCGEGHLTQAVFGGASSLVGVDLSARAISRASARNLPNTRFHVADLLDFSFGGYDVITAVECLYYLSAPEQSAALDKITREHRDRIFILSAPIIGGQYFTHEQVLALLAKHGMTIIEFRNIVVRWDTRIKHAAAIALKLLPMGYAFADYLPSSFIYQRCYVAKVP